MNPINARLWMRLVPFTQLKYLIFGRIARSFWCGVWVGVPQRAADFLSPGSTSALL
jgi:hypothetical protein